MFSMGSPFWIVVAFVFLIAFAIYHSEEKPQAQTKKPATKKRVLRQPEPGDDPADYDAAFTEADLKELSRAFQKNGNGNGYH